MNEQAVRSSRPARWGRTLLLGVTGGALLVLALVCAFGADLHHGVGVATCQSRQAPDSFPPEGIRIAHRTLVPLGTACEFIVRSGRTVIVPEADWRATWTAVGGSVLLAGAVISFIVRRPGPLD